MNPVLPQVDNLSDESMLVKFISSVPGVEPLPALIEDGHIILTRWQLSPVEAEALAEGGFIDIRMWTGGGCPPPMSVGVPGVDYGLHD